MCDEHQSPGIEIGLAFEPGPLARGDVGAPARRRARFFLKLITMAIEEPPHRFRSRYGRQLSAAPSSSGECDVRRLLHDGQQERGAHPVLASRAAGHRLSDRARVSGPSGATHQPNGWRSTSLTGDPIPCRRTHVVCRRQGQKPAQPGVERDCAWPSPEAQGCHNHPEGQCMLTWRISFASLESHQASKGESSRRVRNLRRWYHGILQRSPLAFQPRPRRPARPGSKGAKS